MMKFFGFVSIAEDIFNLFILLISFFSSLIRLFFYLSAIPSSNFHSFKKVFNFLLLHLLALFFTLFVFQIVSFVLILSYPEISCLKVEFNCAILTNEREKKTSQLQNMRVGKKTFKTVCMCLQIGIECKSC